MAGDARPSLDLRGVFLNYTELDELDAARDPPPQHPWSPAEHEQVHRDPAEEQVNEFYEVRVMRWRGGWAARVSTPSVYTPLTLAPRNPINQWQAGPWRRGAGRYRVLIDQAPAVGDAAEGSARRHLPRFERFLRPLRPRSRVERACACERMNVHMCEARAFER